MKHDMTAIASLTGGIAVATETEITAVAGRKEADRLVKVITSNCPPPTGKHWSIGYQTGGFALELLDERETGSKVSPRLPIKQLESWIGAFIDGYDFRDKGASAVTSALNKSAKETLLKEIAKKVPTKSGFSWVIEESGYGSQLAQKNEKTGGLTTVNTNSLKGKEFEIFLRAFLSGIDAARSR